MGRSTVDRRPQRTMYGADYEAETGELARGENRKLPRSGTGWRGAGGRWLVWTFRVVVWVILLVIGYRGVMAIVLNETPPTHTPPAPTASAPDFPVQEASAYALQFGQAYLNASPANASQRASDLASFLPSGADSQLGWNGGGSLRLQSEQVAGVRVQDAQHAIVTLLARVNGQLMELGVPVYAAAAGGMVISGEPAWLAAPKTVTPPPPQPVNSDTATQAALMRQLPAFFTAYASGDQSTLGRFLAPGTTVTGLGGSVVFGSVTGVTTPAGGNVRHIVATVVWEIPGQPGEATHAGKTTANLEMTYALTIVRQHGTWYVQGIAPSTQAGGQP